MTQVHEPEEDAALMQAVVQGDLHALRQLVDRWQAPLGSFVYRYVQNMEVTQEIVQESFVRLYQSRTRYDSQKRFSSWLFKIASNLCKNYYRWRSRHPENLGIDESLIAGEAQPMEPLLQSDSPAEQSVREEELHQLKCAIKAMPHPLKTTLLLYYYEQMSYKEIADIVGCSARGVETRLYRARKWLSKHLEEFRYGNEEGATHFCGMNLG